MITKNQMVCFRLPDHLRESLQKIAATEKKSLSSTIVATLQHMVDHRAEAGTEERRAHKRKKVSVPALLVLPDGSIVGATVKDVAPGGALLTVPSGLKCDPGDEMHLTVVFTLPHTGVPVAAQCISKHMRGSHDTDVGVSFSCLDNSSVESLKKGIDE